MGRPEPEGRRGRGSGTRHSLNRVRLSLGLGLHRRKRLTTLRTTKFRTHVDVFRYSSSARFPPGLIFGLIVYLPADEPLGKPVRLWLAYLKVHAGPIGLLTIAALRAAQAGRIWAVEPLAHRRELARQMGADAALEPEEAVQEILRVTGQRGDCAIDCAAGEHTTSQAIQLARIAGRVA